MIIKLGLYFLRIVRIQGFEDLYIAIPKPKQRSKFCWGALLSVEQGKGWGSSYATKSARELRFHIQNISQAQAMYQNKH